MKYSKELPVLQERLNSNGQQFHQYQHVPSSIQQLNEHKKSMMEIQVLSWNRYKYVTGLNQLLWSQTFQSLLTKENESLKMNDDSTCNITIVMF